MGAQERSHLTLPASSSSARSSKTMVAMKAMKAGARAMTGGDLTKKIAESTQLKNKDVKNVFAALRTIACAEVKKTEKFVIPQITTLKLKHKPASKVVKAFPAKALKDSI